MKTIKFICLLSLLVFFSCKEKKLKNCENCINNNDNRKTLSLPIINSNWKRIDKKNTYTWTMYSCIWENPEYKSFIKTGKAIHVQKIVKLKDGKLIEEKDVYYSGKKDIDDKFDPEFPSLGYERLIITYNYIKKVWSILTINCPKCDQVSSQLTLKQANKILEKWGIKRLNY